MKVHVTMEPFFGMSPITYNITNIDFSDDTFFILRKDDGSNIYIKKSVVYILEETK